jgi:hypothetical protein
MSSAPLLRRPLLQQHPASVSLPAWANKALHSGSLLSANQQHSLHSAKHLPSASLHSPVSVKLPRLVVVDQHSASPRSRLRALASGNHQQ